MERGFCFDCAGKGRCGVAGAVVVSGEPCDTWKKENDSAPTGPGPAFIMAFGCPHCGRFDCDCR